MSKPKPADQLDSYQIKEPSLVLLAFTVYRFIKHLIFGLFGAALPTNSCRFQPSCSAYCAMSIKTHGLFKGSFYCLRRISRCHPLSSHSGHDPVPKPTKNHSH